MLSVWFLRALALLWVVLVWAPSLLQLVGAVVRGYFPVGLVLTPSAMPSLPPLSLVAMVPVTGLCEAGSGYYVYYYEGVGLASHVPFIHYFECGDTARMVVNAKASLQLLPGPPSDVLDLFTRVVPGFLSWYVNALIPPYTIMSLPAPSDAVYVGYVVWYLDGRAVAALWAAILAMPRLVHRGRVVF